jgi:outer membrane protein OmpA-like peptidoglycan-associated protein
MLKRITVCLLAVSIGGCSSLSGGSGKQSFSVFFQPYSADLDQQAQTTIHTASAFAKDHPMQPVVLVGYSAPPDPGKDVPGLSDNRATAVKAILIADGVGPGRISVDANGITDPGSLPTLSVRRVDIQVGP